MEDFLRKLTEAAEKIADKVAGVAPDAWELVLAATRVEGIYQVVMGAVLVLSAVGLIYGAVRLYRWCKETDRWMMEKKYGGDVVSPWTIPVLCCGIGGSVMAVIGAIKVTNIWYWAAIFYPKIYIAHKALESVGAQ